MIDICKEINVVNVVGVEMFVIFSLPPSTLHINTKYCWCQHGQRGHTGTQLFMKCKWGFAVFLKGEAHKIGK